MIENLNGIHETVNYQEESQIMLYFNDEYENYPPHWHTPYEIIMPIENNYRVKCADQEYILREGDIIIIAPAVLHELFAPETGTRLIFQPTLFQFPLAEKDLISSALSPATLITPEEYPDIHPRLHELMLEIKDEYFSSHLFKEAIIYAKVLEMLVIVSRNLTEHNKQHFEGKDPKQKEYLEKFMNICTYINEYFSEDLTLEGVATLAGFSKYHFSRLFKQYADTSFYKYLNQKRIDHAKHLLLNPDLSVIEIALQSGFSSLSAFLRMFKLINNCTPTEFRKMYDY